MMPLLLLLLIMITIQTIVVNMETVNCGTRERLYPYFNNVDNHNNNDNNRYYQMKWQTGVDADDGMNKVSNYRASDSMNDDDDAVALVKRRNIINKLTSDDNQNFETLLSEILDGISGNNNKLMKRSYYHNNNNNGDKNKRASFPSGYPEIMTEPGKNTLHENKPPPQQLLSSSPLDGANFDLTYNSLWNQLNQLQTSGQLASLTNANSGRSFASVDDNGGSNDRTKANKLTFKADRGRETADASSDTANSGTTGNTCNSYIDPTNATAVLERVLQELELIKSAKMGNMTPEGTPCPITNVWNSEIIGLRFNISLSSSSSSSSSTGEENNNGLLNVALMEHKPPKANAQMDTNWSCSGYTLHKNGGPFYLTAIKKHKELMGTFTGICKTCGGMDTIFGVWNFVHTPKDCRDLQMFVETKRDIFRKDILHMKKQEKVSSTKTTTTTTTTEKPPSSQQTDTTKLNKETKDLLDELASYLNIN